MKRDLNYYLSLEYPVETRKLPEELGGGYIASIPSFGKAVTGHGETRDEAIRDLEESKALAIEFFLEKGFQVPEPDPIFPSEASPSGKFITRITPELHARMNKMAARKKMSRNSYVVEAIQEKVAKDEAETSRVPELWRRYLKTQYKLNPESDETTITTNAQTTSIQRAA